jgi:hypothetical protein
VNKWYLFQGYLKQFTEDGDLNRVRSAINRHFDDEVQERPIMGVAVRRSIVEWKMEMDEMKKARGEEPGLNRVPCPEAAVRMLIEEGERADGADLGWFALQLVMLLCWLRADSVAGFQPGDCVVNADGSLTVCVRHLKMRPHTKMRSMDHHCKHWGMLGLIRTGDATKMVTAFRKCNVIAKYGMHPTSGGKNTFKTSQKSGKVHSKLANGAGYIAAVFAEATDVFATETAV